MLNRERDTLTSWINSLKQEDEARKAEAAEKLNRRKIRNESWKRRIQEDITYLSPFVAMAKDAAQTLRDRWPDARVAVKKPDYSESVPSIIWVDLTWDYKFGHHRYGEEDHWRAKRVSFRVERSYETNEIKGIYFKSSGETYSEPEEIRQRIIKDITGARAENIITGPSLVKNFAARARRALG